MVVLVLVTYLRRMSPPPRKIRPKKRTATKLRTWRGTLLRQRAQPLGTLRHLTSGQARPPPLDSLD